MHTIRKHPHTGEFLHPVGYRRNGAPIWPILGASPDDEGGKKKDDDEGAGDGSDGDGDEGDGDEGDDDEGEGDGDLGDKGKQALDRMKGKLNTTRADLREFKKLGLSPAKLRELIDASKGDEGGQGGDKVDVDKIREEARAEARAEGLKDRITDKIEVRAAKGFADAEDAVAILLRSHDIEDFLDGDTIDVEAIQEALDELLEKKPHLAAQGGKRFTGKADGGKRKADRPDQLTRSDLQRMSPSEILKAKADGRLADLMGSK
jgi:hypothetical protein